MAFAIFRTFLSKYMVSLLEYTTIRRDCQTYVLRCALQGRKPNTTPHYGLKNRGLLRAKARCRQLKQNGRAYIRKKSFKVRIVPFFWPWPWLLENLGSYGLEVVKAHQQKFLS